MLLSLADIASLIIGEFAHKPFYIVYLIKSPILKWLLPVGWSCTLLHMCHKASASVGVATTSWNKSSTGRQGKDCTGKGNGCWIVIQPWEGAGVVAGPLPHPNPLPGPESPTLGYLALYELFSCFGSE